MSDPLDLSALGLTIQKRRIELKVSQYTLADMSGVARSAVRRIETGDPNIKLADVYYVCNALGLSISDLIPSQSQVSDILPLLTDFLSNYSTTDQDKIITGFATALAVIMTKV